MEAYLENLRQGFIQSLKNRNCSSATIEAYSCQLKDFWAFLGDRAIADARKVGRSTIADYYASLKLKGVGSGSLGMRVRALKRLFEHLEASGVVLINPTESLKEPRAGKRLPRAVPTVDEVNRVLDQPDVTRDSGLRDRAVLETFYSSGLRLAEMAGLHVADLDLKAGLLRVNSGKGGKDRVVPLGDHAVAFIQEYLKKVRAQAAKADARKAGGFLWLNHLGRPLSKQLIGKMVRRCARVAGIKTPLSPHALRHAFATHLVKNGADISVLREILGHSELKVTQRYVEVAGGDVKAAHQKTHPRENDHEAVEDVGKPPKRRFRHHG
jgi:site-specific recombinase XerD